MNLRKTRSNVWLNSRRLIHNLKIKPGINRRIKQNKKMILEFYSFKKNVYQNKTQCVSFDKLRKKTLFI